MARNLSREVEHLHHHRAFPNDTVELKILQQLLLERFHAPPLIVKRGDIVQGLFQMCAVDRFWQEIRRSSADCFERRFQRVFSRHQNHVHAGITAQRPVQELVPIHLRHTHGHQHEPAPPVFNEFQHFLGIMCGERLISHLTDRRRQNIELHWIIIKNAGRKYFLWSDDFERLWRGGYHGGSPISNTSVISEPSTEIYALASHFHSRKVGEAVRPFHFARGWVQISTT